MKNLKSSLFQKFESNRVGNLAKVVGGAPCATKYDNGYACGTDTLDLDTYNGYVVYFDSGRTCQTCDFTTPNDIIKAK